MPRTRAAALVITMLASTLFVTPFRCLAAGKSPKPGSEENPYSVTLDHATGIVNPYGPLRLGDGDWVRVTITSTQPASFSYNLVAKDPQSAPPRSGMLKTMELVVQHDGSAASYQVTATCLRAGTCELPDRVWVLPVVQDKWEVSFAGAFTVDGLTDEVHTLVPETVAQTEGTPSTQYRVRRNKDAEDSSTISTAAMVHLYHARKLALGKSIRWSPISFGLGLSSGSDTRYYIGTSLKFGDAAFLTAGAVFGKTARLPNGLVENGVTTDANALNGSATRSQANVFIGLSYGFAASEAKARLLQPFSVGQKSEGGGGVSPAEEKKTEPAGNVTDLCLAADEKELRLTLDDKAATGLTDAGKVRLEANGAAATEVAISGKTLTAKFESNVTGSKVAYLVSYDGDLRAKGEASTVKKCN